MSRRDPYEDNYRTSRKPQIRRNRIFMVLILVAIAAIAVAAVFHYVTNQKLDGDIGYTDDTSSANADIITYDGKQYRLNDHLTNCLFMGVDTSGDIQTAKLSTEAGQSDSIFLVSYNRQKKTTFLTALPRDTITQIETFSADGKSLGYTMDHLNLQYAYGDGKEKSCRLSMKAVSKLLNNIPITKYCAMNLNSIPDLTGELDGVQVVVPDDSLEQYDSTFKKGATVTLTPENTELFLRKRDTTQSQSALARMKRQSVFINAFIDRVTELQKKDEGTVSHLYDKMQEKLITNMGSDDFLHLAMARKGDTTTIPGEGGEGEDGFDIYTVDDSALFKYILDNFYVEVGSSEDETVSIK